MTTPARKRKNPAAAALARRRAAKLTPEQRRDSARRAARVRWGGTDALGAATPVGDLSVLIGGLPDGRGAESVLADLRAARRPRRVSA